MNPVRFQLGLQIYKVTTDKSIDKWGIYRAGLPMQQTSKYRMHLLFLYLVTRYNNSSVTYEVSSYQVIYLRATRTRASQTTLSKLFLSPSKRALTYKKEFALRGSKFFSHREDPFQKGTGVL